MGVGGKPHAPAASTPGKDPVPIVQEAGWAPGPVWTGGKSRPHRDSTPDRPARSQSLFRLSYPAHCSIVLLKLFEWPRAASWSALVYRITYFSVYTLVSTA